MSLNDIRLPKFIIDELYKDSLVVSPWASAIPPSTKPQPTPLPKTPSPAPAPAASTTSPAEPAGYKFLGNHRRKITILVHSPGAAFLPDDQLSFLTKILEACRMNIGDVAIINTATAPVGIAALKEQLHPETILLFGVEPPAIRLPINFPAFRLQPYDDCTYLSAPGLDIVSQPSEESRLLKSKLWVCLKTLFNV